MKVIRRIINAVLDMVVPRNYILRRAHGHALLVSEITAHLMVARSRLYDAISASIVNGHPIMMPPSPGHIELSNGCILTIEFHPQTTAIMNVSLGTSHKDHPFEAAMWKVMHESGALQATGASTELVERLGLNHCTVVGVDAETRAAHLTAMRHLAAKPSE